MITAIKNCFSVHMGTCILFVGKILTYLLKITDIQELTLSLCLFFSEVKAIELYKQLKAKCKS